MRAWSLAELYSPTPPRRVGILSIAGALSDRVDEVSDVLAAGGHTRIRRYAVLQPRIGEEQLRVADVHEFLQTYGHEYALAGLRSWPAADGAEIALVEAAAAAGCRVLWESAPGDPVDRLAAAGAVVV